ncbi:MAG: hypothetical protein HY912_05845 [Desulfomonile tiedjei]|uniref:Uncharacterized protein n=1 Tax=Desulfomonile tiedjei TaxID=2358 RepID=A0A9D6Z2P8_9BACT|nr:hypothetical protein [Desulfomonile tiedjei]
MTSNMLKRFGDRVGYTEADLEQFRNDDPRVRLMEKIAAAAARYSIEAMIVQARHCNSGYKTGDRFVLDIDGNFISKLCPKRLCVYAVSQLAVPVALVNERLSEGLAPNEFHFMRHVRCLDVGVECSGYGGIMMKVSVISRDQEA